MCLDTRTILISCPQARIWNGGWTWVNNV